jgi:hypothetical protein
MFRDQLVHFIDSVKNKTTPLTHISNVIGGHKIALKIIKAISDNNS